MDGVEAVHSRLRRAAGLAVISGGNQQSAAQDVSKQQSFGGKSATTSNEVCYNDANPSSSAHAHAEKINNGVQIRRLTAGDQPTIWEMLMLAAHEDTVEDVKSQSILLPYGQDFGRKKHDIGLAAVRKGNNRVVGAAWVRLIDSGLASGAKTSSSSSSCSSSSSDQHQTEEQLADTDQQQILPELAIAVLPDCRGRGVGTKLLESLLRVLRQNGTYSGVCLSCRENNPALVLYERAGFCKVPGSEITNRTGGITFSMEMKF